MEKYSVVKGKSIKAAINELVCILEQKSTPGIPLRAIISEFKDMYILFSDEIFYPSEIYDLLQEGKNRAANTNDGYIGKDLHHRCVHGIHYILATNEDFVNKQIPSASYNSEDYYIKKIATINNDKAALVQEIDDLKKKLNQAQMRNLST